MLNLRENLYQRSPKLLTGKRPTLTPFSSQLTLGCSRCQKNAHTVVTPALQEREIILCIDETGDRKGKTTDYVARQYIGNLGKLKMASFL